MKKMNVRPAFVLMVICLISAVALAGVNELTKDQIAANQMAANLAAFQTVLPDAAEFAYDDAVTSQIEDLQGTVYGDGAFGKCYINEAVRGTDAGGAEAGWAISATSMEGFEGEITLTVGFLPDGTVEGIAFTTLNETAGMGMRVDEDSFKSQFAGVNTSSFTLNKRGGSVAEDEIDSISGASTTSGAVVNAVNAAISFYQTVIAQ